MQRSHGFLLLGVLLGLFGEPAAAAVCPVSGLVPLHSLTSPATAPKMRRVRVAGIVTGRFPQLKGYFIEAPRAAWDHNPATSEAVFVYAAGSGSAPMPGRALALRALARDFHGSLELVHPRVIRRCGTAELPAAIALNLPLKRRGGWLGLQGMRVYFAQPLTVSDLYDFGRYAEVGLTAAGRVFAAAASTRPGPGALRLQAAVRRRSVWLNDGSYAGKPWPVVLAGHRFDARESLRLGQTVDHLHGIVHRGFGRNLIEPLSFTLDRRSNRRRTVKQLHLPSGLRVISFNVENFFNHAFAGAPFPTERGAKTHREFVCQRAKLVRALTGLDPALAGLEEIENNGYGPGSALADLVAGLNAGAGANYRYVRPPTQRLGTDLISVALVYDPRQLVRVGRVAELTSDASPALEAGLKRPVLAASFRETSTGRMLTVAVVHLRSKRSRCGPGLDGPPGAGYCARARLAAVTALNRWLATDPTGMGGGVTLVLGDFNAYPYEAAVRAMRAAGWVNALAAVGVPPRARYTTSYAQGSGELDYIFADFGSIPRLKAARVWHIDADEAAVIGYRGHPSCDGTGAAYRASDHDPVVVVLGERRKIKK